MADELATEAAQALKDFQAALEDFTHPEKATMTRWSDVQIARDNAARLHGLLMVQQKKAAPAAG